MPNTTDDCGNAGPWKTRKPRAGSPSFTTVLGNRYAIPTFPQSRGDGWKSGNPKAGFPLFHRTNVDYQFQFTKEASAEELYSFSRLILRLENARIELGHFKDYRLKAGRILCD